MRRLLLAVGVAAVVLAGCAAPAPMEFNIENPVKADKRVDVELKTITVKTAPKEQQLKEIDWFFVENAVGHQFIVTSTGTGIPVTRQWESALRDAIDQSYLFKDDAKRKVSLLVSVKKIDMTGLASVTSDVVAEYRIVDRETGRDLYRKDISFKGVAKTSEAFVGAVRSRLSFVRAIKGNIQAFIDDLKSADISFE